jgi:hypothetical protein
MAVIQLYPDVVEVGPEPLIVKVLPEDLRDFDGLVLWQLRRVRDVQQQSAELGERRLFVAAAWRR